MQQTIITGKTGPYKGSTLEGWGRNASVNFKTFVSKPPSDTRYAEALDKFWKDESVTMETVKRFKDNPDKFNKYLQKNYGAPDQKDAWTPKYTVSYSKPDKRISIKNNALLGNPKVNYKSLFGFASEDMKGAETSVEKNPYLAAADTDDDGRISTVENAAFILYQDALDAHPDIAEAGKLNITPDDIDGNITEVGVNHGSALLIGKSKDNTKRILADIREIFELDKKI